MNWLLRLDRDLNDCWGGQGKFKVKIKHCAVLQTQPCLVFSLRAILFQRETQNRENIYSQRENLKASESKHTIQAEKASVLV